MPASIRTIPSLLGALLVFLLAAPAAGALEIGGAKACHFKGECYTVQRDPRPPAPRPGLLAMLGFGLALVLLRGQRPADVPFRAMPKDDGAAGAPG
jgi:hypothetical protein